ncbi:MAG: hypothetical protein ACR2JY_10400 [Chloroflexota bacterium]
MSFYRYCDTLGESSSAILERKRQRGFQRQVTVEALVLLLTALVVLAIVARLLVPGSSTLPPLGHWLAVLQS